MANPVWTTPINLGTFVNNSPVTVEFIATPIAPATYVKYKLVGGILPPGLTFTETGSLSGVISTPYTNNTYNFTIQAIDNYYNYSFRSFTITAVINLTPPTWNTPAGSIGIYGALMPVTFQFDASFSAPAGFVKYKLLSGSLPEGLTLDQDGLLSGTPAAVSYVTDYNFAVRVTDSLNQIRDRTFSMSVSGTTAPTFTTPAGFLLSTQDSIWTTLQIGYNNPNPANPISISVREGLLPPGLEINETGLIRGYPNPPTTLVTVSSIITNSTQTLGTTNEIVCLSTNGFTVGRQVVFSGTTFGGIVAGQTYYVQSITGPTTFTISLTQNGNTFLLSDELGFMVITLPAYNQGEPTIRTYNFTLEISSTVGSSTAAYSITVINQNVPVSQGGPGKLPNTRIPTIYNTRPPSYDISTSNIYYGYYINPIVPINQPALIGTVDSGNYFAFKVIGYDFDGNDLTYIFNDVPLGLVADPNTGWITGTPTSATESLNTYSFGVAVYKKGIPSLMSPVFSFSFKLSNQIVGDVVWITDSDLGIIYNETVSTLSVNAVTDVQLNYRLIDGSLPPNLTLLDNGEITGYVANQPTSTYLSAGDTSTFTFTVQAFSPDYPSILSNKTFTVTVLQEFTQPTDVLYIKCTPSLSDRQKINTLLTNDTIIPESMLYRPNDQYFGKATDVIYQHAYGIYASNLAEYFAAVSKNHYWRNITLGEIKTAVARNSAGNIIYEVVYSEVIDNLINPSGVSIPEQIYWPRDIDLGLGPWYTSITEIYTSYDKDLPPGYYTSRTPGYARTLYPNSLPNMRNRVAQTLGAEYNSKLLPLWMTSQQLDGSTTGFIPAWVICYTKPGFSTTIKNNIDNLWAYTLNEINFKLDRFSVNKSITYNYDDSLSPPAWTDLPSATPTPNPIDSKDFYVLFPRQTILPDETQY